MISQPVYVWYHFLYMGDNLSTIFFISYPLCMTTEPWVLIRPHTAYVWDHLCYRRRHIRSITPSQNLYDFTSTSGMTSHNLYQKSQQLYHCHHNLSTEITPSFYFITPTISVTSYALYITLYPLLMSSNYSTYDTTNLTYETTSTLNYAVQNIHYPCDITVTNLCHHTHCIENLTPTLCMTSHSA